MSASFFPMGVEQVFFVNQCLLTVLIGLIALSSLDDMLVDLIYIGHRIRICLGSLRSSAGETAGVSSAGVPSQDICLSNTTPPQFMVIFIPVWDESRIIEKTLRYLLKTLDYPHYKVLLGVYPNDPATLAAARKVKDARVHIVITEHKGPTTKGDCLNALWKSLADKEKEWGHRARAIVVHDAEDNMHAEELQVFNRHIGTFDMIQIPVVPKPKPSSRWISGHYMDEFAEAHNKDLVTRCLIGAAMPSAGAGFAVNRDFLDKIAAQQGGRIARKGSLTEDYELGIQISLQGGRTKIIHAKAKGGEPIVTKSYFPSDLKATIRQKSRWQLGIALQGWENIGWQGNKATLWMLARDRKYPFCTIALLLSCLSFWISLGLCYFFLDTFSLIFWPVLYFALIITVWRVAMRLFWTAKVYSVPHAFLSPVRLFVGHFINTLSCLRALSMYVIAKITKRALPWDKTQHSKF